MFIETQGHPGSASDCIASPQGLHPSTTDFLRVFSTSIFIKADAKVFNLPRRGQLCCLVFKSYDFFGFPPPCKEYSCRIRISDT